MDLLVLAKEPVAGRVKTRLTPPCSPDEAAALAAAALADTLAAAVACSAQRVVLALEGDVGPWCPPGVEVVEQATGDLADRLEALWSHASGPAVQIGMDTPQVDAALLDEALGSLSTPSVDAALGLAADGGWWCLGLAAPAPGCFAGIATSRPDTGARQLERLHAIGRRTALLPVLRDVDLWDDAAQVAALAPRSAFAVAQRSIARRVDALAST